MEALPRARFISVSFYKETVNTKVGMVLTDEDDFDGDDYDDDDDYEEGVRVSGFKKDSMLLNTPLQAGDRILAVNGTPCADKSKSEVVQILRRAKGRVTIVAKNDDGDGTLVESMAEKPSTMAPAGIIIKANVNNLLEVVGMSEDGPFSDSLLAAGDLVLSVNSIDCQTFEPPTVRDIIKKSPGRVSIMCQSPKSLAASVEHADLKKMVSTHFGPQDLDDCDEEEVVAPLRKQRASHPFSRELPADSIPPRSGARLAPVEVTKLPPDQYGQSHPVETPALIAYKLQEFDDEVDNLHTENKTMLMEAMRRCPQLLTSKFKLMFLRCEVFNADLAAKRYALYWERRVEVFEDDAFKPLTIRNCLYTEEHQRPFHRNAASLIMVGGRLVRVMNASRTPFTQNKNKGEPEQSLEAARRFAWYLHHASLENEEFQKKGMILINYLKGLKEVDREQSKKIQNSIRGAMPIRLSAYHFVHAPRFITLLFATVSPLIPSKLRKRFLFHNGTDESILDKMEGYGLPREELPTYMGGGVEVDLLAWFESRLAADL